MIDAKPIPGTDHVVYVFSPGHGQLEHQGYITIVDPGNGPDDRGRAKILSQASDYRDPYPLGDVLTELLLAHLPEAVG